MKTPTAVAVILIVSITITGIMVGVEMNTLKYALFGGISVTSFLPLVFGIIMSVVVAANKKEDKTDN